jgi:hypothetical protein
MFAMTSAISAPSQSRGMADAWTKDGDLTRILYGFPVPSLTK